MLTGRDAKTYRSTISGVTIEELAEYISIDNINRVEDDTVISVDNDIITQYYRAVNKIKQDKAKISKKVLEGFPVIEIITDEGVIPVFENTPDEETVKKPRKSRQPKAKT